MRLQPWYVWALALGCVGWQGVTRIGQLLTGMAYHSSVTPTGAMVGVAAILGLIVPLALIVIQRGNHHLLVGLMVPLTFAPFLVVGPDWPPAAGLLGAAILLSVRGLAGWSLFAVVAAADMWIGGIASGTDPAYTPAYRVLVYLLAAFIIFAAARLAQVVQQNDESRQELARREVQAERSRAERDLRAAVGARLSTLIYRAKTTVARPAFSVVDVKGLADLARHAAADARSIANMRRCNDPTHARIAKPATVVHDRFAWWMSVLIVLAYAGVAANNAMRFDEPLAVIPVVIAAATLQVCHGPPRPNGTHPRWWRWTLSIQILLLTTTVPVGSAAIILLYLAAGVIITRVRTPWSWLWVAGIAVVNLISHGLNADGGMKVWGVVYLTGTLATGMLSVYVLCNLPPISRELINTRAELARIAVMTERVRFARDVHDLLGRHLSVACLKAERAAQCLDSNAAEARDHVHAAVEAAERALAEVRSINSVGQEVRADSELAAAADLLGTAGIEVTSELPREPLPGDLDRLIGVIIREAVTNIVRHSAATEVTIDVRSDQHAVAVRVTNNGVDQSVAGVRAQGTGLANLTARVTVVGGRLEADTSGHIFVLSAELPLAVDRADRHGTPAVAAMP